MSAPLPVFVINLVRAAERRARITGLLETMGTAYICVAAIDGAALDEAATAFWRDDPERARLNAGEIGCLLSHIAIWQRIIDEKLPGAIVLEDDLCFASDFPSAIIAAGSLLEETGLLRLEADRRAIIMRNRPAASMGGYSAHKIVRSGPVSTGAYAINAATARLLLAKAERFEAPVDAELYCTSRTSILQLKTYQFVPPVCIQAQYDTVLANDAPFLSSIIGTMGKRAEAHERYRGQRLKSLPPAIRRPLKHVRRFVDRLSLAPRGWQRFQMEGLDTPYS